eukprot:g11150.t1
MSNFTLKRSISEESDSTDLSLSQRLRLRLGRTGAISLLGPKSPRTQGKNVVPAAPATSKGKNNSANSRKRNYEEDEERIIGGKHMKIIRKLWRIILDYTSSHHKTRGKQVLKKKLSTFSLSDVKFIATFFNYADEGWQRITSKKHRAQLVDELYLTIHEIFIFRENVLKSMAASRKKIKKLKKRHPKLEESYSSSIHIIPSGSGVLVDMPNAINDHGNDLMVLTCSHCIYEGEDDEESEESNRKNEGKKRRKLNTSEKEAYGLSTCNNHKGRYKIIIFNDGSIHVAQCVYNSDRSDVAFLRVLKLREGDSGHSSMLSSQISSATTSTTSRYEKVKTSKIAAVAAKQGDDVYCIHNPYDWDLELAEGARPRRNGFLPFTISSGDIDGYSDGGAGKSGRIIVHNDLGALMHSCWTYWGSSGAPIFNRKSGEIVGIHNSWDPSCGQRHAVGVEGINFCVDDMLKMQT